MSEEQESSTLGESLSQRRKSRGLSLEQVMEMSKISLKTLIAMEEDNYTELPAPAFTRGFYGIYADILGLDRETILREYDEERDSADPEMLPPQHMGERIQNLAEKPLISIFSIASLSAFLLFIIFIVSAWVFSWNPASFLSRQLRSLDNSTVIETGYQAVPPPLATQIRHYYIS